jgi:hypothetical protein
MEKGTSPYVLVRVDQGGTEHPTFEDGWQAGTHAVHVGRDGAYSLYRGRRRIARFCHHRIAVSPKSFEWSVLG